MRPRRRPPRPRRGRPSAAFRQDSMSISDRAAGPISTLEGSTMAILALILFPDAMTASGPGSPNPATRSTHVVRPLPASSTSTYAGHFNPLNAGWKQVSHGRPQPQTTAAEATGFCREPPFVASNTVTAATTSSTSKEPSRSTATRKPNNGDSLCALRHGSTRTGCLVPTARPSTVLPGPTILPGCPILLTNGGW